MRARGTEALFGSSEGDFRKLVAVPVGAVRSQVPVVDCPVNSGSATVSGTAEADATIDLLFQGIDRDTATASPAGGWSAAGFAGFGSLYSGLEITATATAPGELVSAPSDPCFVGLVCQEATGCLFLDSFESGGPTAWSARFPP
jgi:hypothetical protein